MSKAGRFAASQGGAVSVDWLVMSAAAFAVAAAAGGVLNSGIIGFASEKLAQILADAVDEVGNDAADRKISYTQGCTGPCMSNSPH